MFEPSADARIAAKRTWDIFVSLQHEGFNSDQAMQILLTMISASIMAGGNE